MVGTTVVDLRYPDRLSTERAAELTPQIAQALRDVSGRPWTIDAYLTPTDRPPMRGTKAELKWVLDTYDLWHKGHAWLWDGGDCSFFEQYWLTPGEIRLWGDVSTDNIDVAAIPAPLVIHCFNCTRGVAEALHSVTHTIERVWDRLDHAGFTLYVGRGDDPMGTYRTTDYAAPVLVYAGGHGNCHVPPGRDHQYEYSGCEGGQEGFLRRWLAALPRMVWAALEGA